MSDVSSPEKPPIGREAANLAAAAALTFEPMVGAGGPSHEHWLQYLVYIRGAVAALRFDDGDLTERMRHGFDTHAEALESVMPGRRRSASLPRPSKSCGRRKRAAPWRQSRSARERHTQRRCDERFLPARE